MDYESCIMDYLSGSPMMELRTSGSTGEPKTVFAEKRRMEASARATCRTLGLKEGDLALLCMSADFIAGKMMVVRSLVWGLNLVVVQPSGHPLADTGDVVFDFAAMVPLQVYNSLQVPAEKERLMNIRNLIIGGGAIDDALAAELRNFPNAVWSTYGMTETLSHIALRRMSGEEADEWYVPMEGVTVSLDGENRIVIEAPEIVDGKLVTNDIGQLAPDGRRFRIIGRTDNVICSGGIKIQAEEVERLLHPHLQCPFMISSRPDGKFGEIVVLLVAGDTDTARETCSTVRPKYMQPRLYIKVESLPLTPTGKPARAEARRISMGSALADH